MSSNDSPSSSPSSASSSNNFPPKKNDTDTDCYNCAGVTVLSHEMMKLGLPSKCYGIEYKAGKSIPPEVMVQLENLPLVKPDSRMYLIGLSQSSARMRRLGQVPIMKFGVKVVLSRGQSSSLDSPIADESENTTNNSSIKNDTASSFSPSALHQQHVSSSSINGNAEKVVKDGGKSPTAPANTTITPWDRLLARYNTQSIQNFATSYKQSCDRLWRGTISVLDRTTEDFPMKFYRSSLFIVDACDKFADKISYGIKKMIANQGESNHKK